MGAAPTDRALTGAALVNIALGDIELPSDAALMGVTPVDINFIGAAPSCDSLIGAALVDIPLAGAAPSSCALMGAALVNTALGDIALSSDALMDAAPVVHWNICCTDGFYHQSMHRWVLHL